MGDLERADVALRRAIELVPQYSDARAELGELLLDRGTFDEADAIFAALSERAGHVHGVPTSLLGRLGRARALLGLGRVDDAAAQVEALSAEERSALRVRSVEAAIALAMGDARRAVTLLADIESASDRTSAVLALRAEALLAMGRRADAIAAADAALAAGETPEALLAAAASALEDRKEDRAAVFLDRVVAAFERYPRPPAMRPRVLLLRARLALAARPPDEGGARESLMRASELAGAPADVFFLLGEVTRATDRTRAVAAYRRYLELAPRGPYAAQARRFVAR
jgi:tetratricopeptide (TPR) repeat protein